MVISNRRLYWVLLCSIMLIAFVLRLITIDHGLPGLQVGDENSDLSTALRLTEGELPERHVRYHRSLIAYVDGAAIAGLFGSEILAGDVRSVAEFRNLYFSDYDRFAWFTRLMMAALTTLAVLFVGLAGRTIHPRIGLLAALVLAVNGFFLINSVFALPDGLVTFSAGFFIWMVMRVWKSRRERDYFGAGFGLALVMLSKFSALYIAAGLVIAHVGIVWDEAGSFWRWRFLKRLVLHPGVLWASLGLVVGNLLLNPLGFIYPNDLRYEINRLFGYAYSPYESSLAGQLKIIWAQIKDMTFHAWRWMVPASLLGLAAARRWKHSVPYWIVVASFLVLLIMIGRVISVNYKVFFWTSWLIPMALLSGIGIDWLIGLSNRRLWRAFLVGVVTILFVLEGLFTFNIVDIFEHTDTRLQAKQYIEKQIPPGTPILIGSPLAYSVPLLRDETSITRAMQLGAAKLESWQWWLDQSPDQRPSPAYDLHGPEFRKTTVGYEALQEMIADNAIQYVIDTEYCWGPKKPASQATIDFPVISDEQRSQWELVRVFSPFGSDECLGRIDDRTGLTHARLLTRQQRTGPIVRIYRVR